MPTEIEKAYLAGLLDARCTIRKAKYERNRLVTFSMKGELGSILCKHISNLTGIEVVYQDSKDISEYFRKGCEEHCPIAHVHVPAVIIPASARWSMSGIAAAIMLHGLMPYLVGIRDQAQEVIDWSLGLDFTVPKNWTPAIKSISRMRGIGWEIPTGYGYLEILETHFPCGHERQGNTDFNRKGNSCASCGKRRR